MAQLGDKARREFVERAAAATFFTGTGDLAEKLSEANMRFGLAKIRYVQEKLGFTPDASFVGAPDATITRNIERWQAGFGYGGRIRYSGRFTVLDIKSNCCGIYFGLLPERPERDELLERVISVQQQDAWHASKRDVWDFGKGNHFLSVVRLESPMRDRSYGLLCHGSGPELRAPGPHGPGLYLSASPRLQELAQTVKTPWGGLNILPPGAATEEYWTGFQAAETEAKARRAALVEAIFPDVLQASNHTHQGALAPNDCYLGCVVEPEEGPIPITLRADLPVSLYQIKPNLTDEVLADLGMLERAGEQGLLEHVRKANLLPHGGGYTVPGYSAIASVREIEGVRVYEMAVDPDGGTMAYHSNFRNIPFGYRGEEVVRRVERLQLGTLQGKAVPLFSLMV